MSINETSKFEIIARTFCIDNPNQAEDQLKGNLLSEGATYRIPIYQRPYSWKTRNLERFIRDILDAYGDGTDVLKEPLFVGTMQLSKPVNGEYEIIDGQQRLTTLLLLFKTLNFLFKGEENFERFALEWIRTDVNNGEQQKSLEEVLQLESFEKDSADSNNLYYKNILIINELMNEFLDTEDAEDQLDIDDFISFLKTSIYFVVIETHAGLSKTLQIFDTINTTGLDLNGSDIFKIRMYEYLTTKKGENADVFNRISRLYERLEQFNKAKEITISFNEILKIYQFVLIAENNLSSQLYKLGPNRFYERLFDTIFKVNTWPNFENTEHVELSINELDKIIEARENWQNKPYLNTASEGAMNLIWQSRYGGYWLLVIIFHYKFSSVDDFYSKRDQFIVQLAKLYFIYSILFKRSVNQIHKQTYKTIKAMISNTDGSYEETMKLVNQKIDLFKEEGQRKELNEKLRYDLTDNMKRKYLILRLAALRSETSRPTESKDIIKRIFNQKVDVEHIQSYRDENKGERKDIRDNWGRELNGLGNLILLERKINRSIGNKNYKDKTTVKNGYLTSNFNEVKSLMQDHPEKWEIENARHRGDSLANQLLTWLLDQDEEYSNV